MDWRDCCRLATERLDRVLDERPDKLHQEMVDALRAAVAVRDELIRAGDRQRLERANAALSLVFGAEIPLAGVRWERVRKARDALADLAGS